MCCMSDFIISASGASLFLPGWAVKSSLIEHSALRAAVASAIKAWQYYQLSSFSSVVGKSCPSEYDDWSNK